MPNGLADCLLLFHVLSSPQDKATGKEKEAKWRAATLKRRQEIGMTPEEQPWTGRAGIFLRGLKPQTRTNGDNFLYQLLNIRWRTVCRQLSIPTDIERVPADIYADIRQDIYHQLKLGRLTCLAGTRAYLYDKDRSLVAEEYVAQQGWGINTSIRGVHRRRPELELKTPEQIEIARKGRKKRVSQDSESDQEAQAQPKKKRQTGKSKDGVHEQAMPDHKRSAYPYTNLTIDLVGNAMNLADVTCLLAVAHALRPNLDGGNDLWQHQVDLTGLTFIEPPGKMILSFDPWHRLSDTLKLINIQESEAINAASSSTSARSSRGAD